MSAIGRVTRAATEAQRTDRGENRIPAAWRARVVYIRETTADCGHRPGVYISVPNFTRGEIHGPVQVVGDTPAEGALVVAVAVEGRKNDWIIITGNDASGILARLDAVEALSAATQSQLDVLDTYVEHYITARMGALEWDVEQLEDRLTSTHGETVNAIGILEAQMGVLDSIVAAHQLAELTWLPSSGRVEIPGYTPQPVAKSYRLEMDIVTENHVSSDALWLRVMDGGSQVLHVNFASQVNRSGDNHRYRFQLDFNAAANADLHLSFAANLRNPSSGRAGYTRPQLSTQIVRSA